MALSTLEAAAPSLDTEPIIIVLLNRRKYSAKRCTENLDGIPPENQGVGVIVVVYTFGEKERPRIYVNARISIVFAYQICA